MPTTYVDYTATAAQTDFAFSFPYLEDEHVTVEIDGVVQLTSAYSIVTTPSTKVVLNVGATAGQIVRVRRKSQPDTNLVDFVNGSVLTESELDRAYQHNRFLNEEISELNDESLQKAAGTNNWDAGNNKIVNVATPTNTNDASTKDYVDAKVNQVSSGASSPPLKWQFTGTAGANTTYSVTGAEIDGDTAYDVSINGLVKEPGVDFTVDPDTDTLTIVPTLSGGEDIVIIQRGFGVAVTTGSIGSSQIQDGAVITAKLAADAVDGSKIADNSVDSEHLAADAVDGTKIADDSINSEHYVDGSIDSVHINTTDPVFNIQTDGDVGIGTASPNAKLNVLTQSDETGETYGNLANSLLLTNQSNTVGAGPKLIFRNESTGSGTGTPSGAIGVQRVDSTNRANLVFITRGTDQQVERMRIESDGKVGVNCKSVSSQFQVNDFQDITGTVSTTRDSTTVTGSGTAFLTELSASDFIEIGTNQIYVVESVDSDTQLTLEDAAFVSTSGASIGKSIPVLSVTLPLVTIISPLRLTGLPTSSAGLVSGDVWNNSGVLNIVP
jgi:hypothetical protein